MTTKKKLMTADELLMLPDDDQRHELLDGVLITMSPPGWPHGMVMANISYLLSAHVRANDLGAVAAGDPGIILRRGPDRVRGPDVCFIARDRLPGRTAPRGYLEIVPDLIVEIVSPGDSAAEVQEKLDEWRRAGARLIWAVYPRTRSVIAYQPDGSARVYTESETIDAEPVLPGFSARVADFFA